LVVSLVVSSAIERLIVIATDTPSGFFWFQ